MIRNSLIYFATYLGIFLACFYFLSIRGYKPSPKKTSIKDLPSISIIMPAYNEQKGIKESIRNALRIDYPKDKIELIVVDDGSKDDTFKIASKFKGSRVRVFRLPKNKGKGHAMNFALSKAKGEIIVTMDADNVIPSPGILKKTIPYFYNNKVMCVTPAMAVYKPKGILQRIQQVEYMFGVFLRKALSSFNAIHITPGAFTIYRKEFFDKKGGFDEENLTEDMEMALRVQYNHYIIENNPEAVVYVLGPGKFVPLMKQRRRWYSGLMSNLWKYKKMFSKEYGILGTKVLPIVVLSVFLSMFLVSFLVTDLILSLKDELILWQSVNFDFINSIELSKYLLDRYVFFFLSNPILIFSSILLVVFLCYMVFAKKRVKQYSNIKLSLFLFLGFYSLLFVFWWLVSFFYLLINKKVSWR